MPQENRRDQLARIRLVVAVLRLGSFTARDLARAANVNIETARSFLRLDKGPKLAALVVESDKGEKRSSVGFRRSGRPARTYYLPQSNREQARSMLEGFRSAVGIAIEDPLKVEEVGDDYSSLAMLEAVIVELEDLGARSPSRKEQASYDEAIRLLVKQGAIYADFARSNTESLRLIDLAKYRDSEDRLSAALTKLAEFEVRSPAAVLSPPKFAREHDYVFAPSRANSLSVPAHLELPLIGSRNPIGSWFQEEASKSVVRVEGSQAFRSSTVQGSAPAPASYLEELTKVVSKFGSFAGKVKVEMFTPVVVALDGLGAESALPSELIQECERRGAAIVRFDLTSLARQKRVQVYREISRLRSATPLVDSEVVMVVNSSHERGLELAKELRYLAKPWHRSESPKHSKVAVKWKSSVFPEDVVRHYYIGLCENIQSSGLVAREFIENRSKLVTVRRVAYALRAVSLVESEPQVFEHLEASVFRRDQRAAASVDWTVYATHAMGQMVCLDVAGSENLQNELSSEQVRYVSVSEHPRDWRGVLYRVGYKK